MGHAFVIEPASFTAFESTQQEIEKCQEWGLLSEKAAKTKTFNYKRAGQTYGCSVVGYVDSIMAVIAFENGQRHCIHPSYLKEMQANSFGQRGVSESASEPAEQVEPTVAASETKSANEGIEEVKPAAAPQPETAIEQPAAEEPASTPTPAVAAPAPAPAPAKEKKSKKLQLPEEKVKMTATVQEFTKVPNHFTEEDDEVVVYGEVAILEPEEIEVGLAWSSFSNTLKKLELQVGDKLTFEAKIAAKKLTKHPVPYKINNPSKLVKI